VSIAVAMLVYSIGQAAGLALKVLIISIGFALAEFLAVRKHPTRIRLQSWITRHLLELRTR